MEPTFFASAERSSPTELEKEIERISNNPVTDELMKIVTGLFAVLNAHRQILAVNDSFLKRMQIEDVRKVFGLRPGELIQCIHANDLPGGCGTSQYCSTCGAVIAVVTSLSQKKTVEKVCAITVEKNNTRADLFFRVRSCPIDINGNLYLLVFLQDISRQQQWATIEKSFFHDINNLLYGLLGRSEMMALDPKFNNQENAEEIFRLSRRLSKEIEIQRHLCKAEMHTYSPVFQETTAAQVVKEIKNVFLHHKASGGKTLDIPEDIPDVSFQSDQSLLIRIISNMIINAFEASEPDDRVKFFIEYDGKWITFSVWNRQVIPGDIAKRIFQRNFSTKGDIGRGLGTFSMKYFGEEILGGDINFSTSPEKGTVFYFRFKTANRPFPDGHHMRRNHDDGK